jgi:hypothetical protein
MMKEINTRIITQRIEYNNARLIKINKYFNNNLNKKIQEVHGKAT